ncbi:MAG: hypothetical protein JW774_04505 [Candidatus Aureabacteria bacterium]|nr:hypothetical protein [Candidatus Auribacterota bacterium]
MFSLLTFFLFRLPPLETSDSASYIEPAEHWKASHQIRLSMGRAPLYCLYHIALSALVNKIGPDFKRFSVDIMTVLYLQAIFFLCLAIKKYQGNLQSLLILLIFLLDRWNHAWIRSVMTEGLVTVLMIYWLIFFILSYLRRGEMIWLYLMAFSASMAYLTREAASPVLFVTLIWACLILRGWVQPLLGKRVKFLILFLSLLILPASSWIIYNKMVNGYLGVSARGLTHISGRVIPLARISEIKNWGSREDLFRPMTEELTQKYHREKPSNDKNSSGTFYAPLFRREPFDYLYQKLKEENPHASEAEALKLVKEISDICFMSNIRENVSVFSRIFVEYLTLPLIANVWGEGKRLINYMGYVIVIFSIIFFIFQRRNSDVHTCFFLGIPVIFLILYWSLCSFTYFYHPRYATLFNFLPYATGIVFIGKNRFLFRAGKDCRGSKIG